MKHLLSIFLLMFFVSCNIETDSKQSKRNPASDIDKIVGDISQNTVQEGNRTCEKENGFGLTYFVDGEYSDCVLNSCREGYFLSNNKCLPRVCDPGEVVSCLVSNGEGQQICNNDGSGLSLCSVKKCLNGYSLLNGQCSLLTNVITCNTGFELVNNVCQAINNTVNCNTGFELINNVCQEITNTTNCQSGSVLINQLCQPLTRSCPITNGTGVQSLLRLGYGPCVATACNQDYVLINNTCQLIPVSCSFGSTVITAIEGESVVIPAPSTTGTNVQLRMKNSISGAILNPDGTVSISNLQASNYIVELEAYNSQSSSTCSVSFIPSMSSLVANPDSASTLQGEALVMPTSSLTSNDVSQLGKTFSIVSVSNSIGGTALLSGSNITFTPTARFGEAASFSYTIRDSSGVEDTATVSLQITQLPQLEALIFNQSQMTEMWSLLNMAPPTMADMFDQWARFSDNNYFTSAATATGAATSWMFMTNPDRVVTTVNSTSYIGFVSPEKLDNYVLQSQVSSTDSDDDAIALLVAFVRVGTQNFTLSAIRTQGGTHTSITQNWSLVYNYKQADQVIVQEKQVDVSYQNTAMNGWSGKSSILKVERIGDSIKVWTSNWNSSTIVESSLISLDLNSHSRYNVFKGKQSYGFAVFSQKDSTYRNISLEGGSQLAQDVIFDIENRQIWRYDQVTGWTLSNEDFEDTIGYPRTVYNPQTDTTFNIDINGNITEVIP